MTITDPEFTNAGARIEAHYTNHPDRYAARETRIDTLGIARWPTDYFTLRAEGRDHEAAIRTVESRMSRAAGTTDPWGPAPRPGPVSGPLPMLRVRDTRFLDELTGQTWKWKATDAYRLFERFLKDEDIGPYCLWGVENRIRLFRVFGMYNGGIGRLVPTDYPDYYVQLVGFLDAVASYGLSVEFTVFADMQTDALVGIGTRQHYRVVRDLLRGRRGVTLELCNEPFKNGMDPSAIYEAVPDLMQALGSYDVVNGQMLHANYVTIHTPRDAEWPRKGKELLDVSRLGWDGFTALRVPCVGDETIGIGYVGARSMVAQDHAAYHAVCALLGAGSTIHSTFGVSTVLPDEAEQRCVTAAVEAMEAVPPECAAWKYTAGHLGDCPLVSSDALALRTYGMIDGGRAVCVRVRPTAAPVARDGWRIVSERGPQGLVVELSR